MYLLKQIGVPNTRMSRFGIYEKRGITWHQEMIFEASNAPIFYKQLRCMQYPISYGLIWFETIYCKMLYELYPQILIAIDEMAVRRYVEELLGLNEIAYEEIAVSLDDSNEAVLTNLLNFIDLFYKASSKEDAFFYYAKWQYERPLNEKKLTKFERVLEFYLKEILNYFDLKRIIKNKN